MADLTAQLASDPAGQAGAGRFAPERPLGNPEQNRAVGQAVVWNRHDGQAKIIAVRTALPAARGSAVAVTVAVALGLDMWLAAVKVFLLLGLHSEGVQAGPACSARTRRGRLGSR